MWKESMLVVLSLVAFKEICDGVHISGGLQNDYVHMHWKVSIIDEHIVCKFYQHSCYAEIIKLLHILPYSRQVGTWIHDWPAITIVMTSYDFLTLQ